MSFKVGDRVMISEDSCYYKIERYDGSYDPSNPPDTLGTIIGLQDPDDCDTGHIIDVQWDGGECNNYTVEDLVRVEHIYPKQYINKHSFTE